MRAWGVGDGGEKEGSVGPSWHGVCVWWRVSQSYPPQGRMELFVYSCNILLWVCMFFFFFYFVVQEGDVFSVSLLWVR